jgi:lysophospholipase L1-like esterase
MKLFYFLPFCVLLLSCTRVQKRKVIFFGDSITQFGTEKDGYILKIKEMEKWRNLFGKYQYEFIGAGVSGNKVTDLAVRLYEDVISKKPDVVVIFIGVNDVWHKLAYGTGTDYGEFKMTYTDIIKRLQAKNLKMILVTPAVIGERTDSRNGLDEDLNRYCSLIRSLAKENNIPLIDLRRAFLDYNKINNLRNAESGILTTDRVHLNKNGNEIVAVAIWNKLHALL